MRKINNPHPSNFWFGFALGTAGALVSIYLLGTKKGRELLKKIIEVSEQFPEKLPELFEEIKKSSLESKDTKFTHLNTIESVINKIKHTSEEK